MSLSYGILGFLSYDSMTGYDLSKIFGSSVRFFWYAQTSHIYLELNKLEKKGFVSCERILQMEKPNKKLYSITDSGKREFLQWLASENENFAKGIKDEFLIKIFFSGYHSPEQSIKKLEKFIDDSQQYLASMDHVLKTTKPYSNSEEDYQRLYWAFTADFGYACMKMRIDWAKRCIDKLKSLEQKQ